MKTNSTTAPRRSPESNHARRERRRWRRQMQALAMRNRWALERLVDRLATQS
jgi:hypothetical protein